MSVDTCSPLPGRRAVLAALAAGAMALAAVPAQAQTKASLLLDWSWWPPQIGIVYAYKKGFYKEAGIDLELKQGNGSGGTVAAVSQGTYQFGFADLPSAAQAMTRGGKLIAVATLNQKNGIAAVYRKSSGIKTPKDLEGRRFGISPTAFEAQINPAFFKANGIDAARINIVNLPGDAKFSTFVAGQTDAVAGNGFYWAALARAKGADVDQFVYGDYGVGLIGFGLVANTDVVKANPDLVRKFVAATLRGFKESFAAIEPAVDIYADMAQLGDDKQLAASIYRNFQALFDSPKSKGNPIGWNSPELWADTVALLRTYGGMADGKPVTDYYTNDFVPK
ncbi:MAG: ABC transporter substrate-binding protein [Alphaproteobacteria bacterium]